jgi:hypothetical protein
VAVGSAGTILTSPEGTTWTKRTSGIPEYLFSVTYGDNQFVAVGMDGAILSSPDGLTWADRTSDTTEFLYSVTYGDNQFVAVGSNGTALTSPDAKTWSKTLTNVSLTLNFVIFGKNRFVAVGEGGIILTAETDSSSDIIWHPSTLSGQNSLMKITSNQHYITAHLPYSAGDIASDCFYNVNIYTPSGRKILSNKQFAKNNSISVPTTGLSQGSYIFSVTSQKKHIGTCAFNLTK